MSHLPNFIIIGAQKAGTTAAARNLSLHNDVSIFNGITEYGQKEIEFFNQHWDRGSSWYTSFFNPIAPCIGEKTAELLHRNICHERMYQINSSLKLIVLLRSPVERVYSQWKMAKYIKKDEPRKFDEVIEESIVEFYDKHRKYQFLHCEPVSGKSNWREGYLLRGLYAEQLESLYRWFPEDQVYIGVSERLRTNPVHEYSKIFQFLGVKPIELPFSDHFVSPPSQEMNSKTRQLLLDLYAKHNQDLFAMLGRELLEWA